MSNQSVAMNQGNKEKSNDLNLFKLTWPIFLEIFLFMLMGIVDTLMLSDISYNAVSGVGASNQLIHIAILILEVIGNGASIVVAQYLGSRQLLKASRISAVAVSLNLIVGLVISLLFITFSQQMLTLMNLQGEVYEHANTYLSIVGGAIFLQAIINSLAAIIRVHGFTKQAMFVSLGMNIVHIILNYVLIFGKLGLPALGVQGAAISSVISRVLAIIVFFWLLYNIVAVKIEFKFYLQLSRKYIAKILKIGIPSALEQVLYHSCQLAFLYYATKLGEETLAARTYASQISMFIYLFALAMGIGTSIIVGRLIGAGEQDRAYKRVWRSTITAFLVSLVMIAVVMIFRIPLMGIFTDEQSIIEIGASVLLLSIILESGRTINIIFINSLRASGDAAFPLYVGLFTMTFSVVLGYFLIFTFNMGLAGIWLAIAADEWMRAIIMSLRWKSRGWEKHALVKAAKKGSSVAIEH